MAGWYCGRGNDAWWLVDMIAVGLFGACILIYSYNVVKM